MIDNKKYSMLWKVYGSAGIIVAILLGQIASDGVFENIPAFTYKIVDFIICLVIFILLYFALIYRIKYLQHTDSEIYRKRIIILKLICYISPLLFAYTAITKFIS